MPDATPLEMMDCVRRKLRLSTKGCARLWRSAHDGSGVPKLWEGRYECASCQVGAMHAGADVSAALASSLDGMCIRCLRTGARIILGLYCVSCFNRRAEAIKGRNAKGNPPKLSSQLHGVQIVVATRSAIRLVTMPHMLSPAEVMLAQARVATEPLAFGRPLIPGWFAQQQIGIRRQGCFAF